MAGIFISYRRADSAGFAGRLWEHVKRRFGAAEVFMDIEGGISRGADFPDAIAKAIESASAMVVVIGRQWLTCTDRGGRRRLDNPDDWVRNEVARAIARSILVLPVLVDDATMPEEADLPEDIRLLARRQACGIRNSSWDYDVGQIVASLAQVVPDRSASVLRRHPVAAAAVVMSLLVAGLSVSSVFLSWPVALRDKPANLSATTDPGAAFPPPAPKAAGPPGVTGSLPTDLGTESPWRDVGVPGLARITTGDFVDANVGWVAGKAGTLIATENGGDVWTPLQTGLTGDIVDVDLLDRRSGWVLDTTGGLASSHDGGQTWTRVRAEGARMVRFSDRQHGLVAGADGGRFVRYTGNGGTSWAPGTLPDGFTMVGPTDLAVQGPTRAWMTPIGAFKQGGILSTVDGGKTWSKQSTRSVYYLTGLSILTETDGWAVGYVFGETFGKASCGTYTTVVFKTTTAGTSWDPVGEGLCGFSGRIAFADATRGWVVVKTKESNSIVATNDGGAHWAKQHDLQMDVAVLRMFKGGGGWAIAEGIVLRYVK